MCRRGAQNALSRALRITALAPYGEYADADLEKIEDAVYTLLREQFGIDALVEAFVEPD